MNSKDFLNCENVNDFFCNVLIALMHKKDPLEKLWLNRWPLPSLSFTGSLTLRIGPLWEGE